MAPRFRSPAVFDVEASFCPRARLVNSIRETNTSTGVVANDARLSICGWRCPLPARRVLLSIPGSRPLARPVQRQLWELPSPASTWQWFGNLVRLVAYHRKPATYPAAGWRSRCVTQTPCVVKRAASHVARGKATTHDLQIGEQPAGCQWHHFSGGFRTPSQHLGRLSGANAQFLLLEQCVPPWKGCHRQRSTGEADPSLYPLF